MFCSETIIPKGMRGSQFSFKFTIWESRHCKEIIKNYHDGFIYMNCGHFVGPFHYNWNAPKERISIRSFDDHPIEKLST